MQSLIERSKLMTNVDLLKAQNITNTDVYIDATLKITDELIKLLHKIYTES
jgi:hypothetical protein